MPGNGLFVDNTEDHFDLTGTGGLVLQRFNESTAYATLWNNRAIESIDKADELLSNFELAPGWNDVLNDVVINPVVGINLPDRPSFGTVTLSDDWPTDFPLFPLLKGAPSIDLGYDKPVAPTDINPTINHTDSAYDTAMTLKMYTTVFDILNGVTTGSTGLSLVVEAAILERDQLRNLTINNAKTTADLRAVGTLGYRFPSGAIAAIAMESSDTVLRQDRESSASLVAKSFEIAQGLLQFSVEKGLDYERIVREFHNNTNNRSLQAKIATGQLIAQVYDSKIKGYIGKWEGIKAEILAKTQVIELILNENKILIDGFKAALEGKKIQADVVASVNSSKIEGFKGEVQGYSAETQAISEYYRAMTEHDKLYLQKAELELTKATEEVKALLQGKISYDNLMKEMIIAVGKLAQEAVASSLNAVNASASLGLGGNQSIGETWSHGDSITEHISRTMPEGQ